MQQKTVAAAAVAVAAVLVMTTVLALLQSSQTVTNTGSITGVNVGVYQDSACTQVLTSINWGTLDPGASASNTIYIKNTGNTQVSLNMTNGNWNPTGTNTYITETWNRESTLLPAGNSTSALLTLSVSSSITGITSFTFNTTITGTKA